MKRSHNAKKSNSVVFNDEKYRGLHTWIQVAMRVKKQLLSFLEQKKMKKKIEFSVDIKTCIRIAQMKEALIRDINSTF